MPIARSSPTSQFRDTFGYSMLMALLTIVFGMLLVVPTAYWVRLRLPQMRPIVEFVTLLPLVIPAIVIVFGYLRMYNSSSILPLTGYDDAARTSCSSSPTSRCRCPICTAPSIPPCAPSTSAR